MPFIFRVALLNQAAHRVTCEAPERGEGVKLSHQRRWGGCGRVAPSPQWAALEGLPQENSSFENALRVSFRPSGVHI